MATLWRHCCLCSRPWPPGDITHYYAPCCWSGAALAQEVLRGIRRGASGRGSRADRCFRRAVSLGRDGTIDGNLTAGWGLENVLFGCGKKSSCAVIVGRSPSCRLLRGFTPGFGGVVAPVVFVLTPWWRRYSLTLSARD